MKKLLNTLYVTTQGAYLCKEGDTVLIRVEDEARLKAMGVAAVYTPKDFDLTGIMADLVRVAEAAAVSEPA